MQELGGVHSNNAMEHREMVRRLLLKPPASNTSLTDASATVVAQMEGESGTHPPDPKKKSSLKSWRHLAFAPGHENMMKKLFAEFFGTFWLVFGGCGSAILAAGFPELGIGFVGVSLAFGFLNSSNKCSTCGIQGS